jgi:hypothetical protein
MLSRTDKIPPLRAFESHFLPQKKISFVARFFGAAKLLKFMTGNLSVFQIDRVVIEELDIYRWY